MGNPTSRFGGRGRLWAVPLAMSLVVSLLGARAQADDPLDPVLGNPGHTYPNLSPNVVDVRVMNYRLIENDMGLFVENGQFLWFDTRAQNLGTVPVQLTVDKVDTPESSTVSQCVSWRLAEAHVCRETASVGGYTWHDEHHHFHYEDFARYQLRTVADNGRPDYSATGLVGVSEKVSFCFIDSEKVREDARPTQFYATCLPSVQGISPGWTDVYTADMAGQNFPVDHLPNGRYAVIIEMDYRNTLYETDQGDNYIEVTIEISPSTDPAHATGRKVEILDKRWPTPDERKKNKAWKDRG